MLFIEWNIIYQVFIIKSSTALKKCLKICEWINESHGSFCSAFGAQRNPWASKKFAEIQHAKLQKMWVMEDD